MHGFDWRVQRSGYFVYYNFARVHQTLRVTPAMEAGLPDHMWSIEEIVGLLWAVHPPAGDKRTRKAPLKRKQIRKRR